MKQKEIDQLEAMYSHYGYRCFICGERATQRAHCIGNTKLNRKLHGNEVVDHICNFYPACSLSCNKKIDIGFLESNQKQVADIIKSDLPDCKKRSMIECLILDKNGIKEV